MWFLPSKVQLDSAGCSSALQSCCQGAQGKRQSKEQRVHHRRAPPPLPRGGRCPGSRSNPAWGQGHCRALGRSFAEPPLLTTPLLCQSSLQSCPQHTSSSSQGEGALTSHANAHPSHRHKAMAHWWLPVTHLVAPSLHPVLWCSPSTHQRFLYDPPRAGNRRWEGRGPSAGARLLSQLWALVPALTRKAKRRAATGERLAEASPP